MLPAQHQIELPRLTLPLYPGLAGEQVDFVADALLSRL